MKAYLAGPDVFYPSANYIGKEKQKLCQNHGVDGLYPLDNEVTGADIGYAIFQANKFLMDRADFCIANLTPFRGPSADVGTVMEMGYMFGQGKPVYAYSNDSWPYINRVLDSDWGSTRARRDGKEVWYDSDGYQIEDFGLHDNLMLDGFIRYQGFDILVPVQTMFVPFDDMSIFERCLKSAVDNMNFRAPKFVNNCGEIGLPHFGIPVHFFGDK